MRRRRSDTFKIYGERRWQTALCKHLLQEDKRGAQTSGGDITLSGRALALEELTAEQMLNERNQSR